MSRNITAALLLSVLLVLAGCNGGGGQSTTANATTAAGTAGGSGTATPPTTEPLYATPLNGSAVVGTHSSELSAAGNFRYVQNATVAPLDRSGFFSLTNVTAKVSLTDSRLFLRQDILLQGPSQIYRNESGVAAQRVVTDGTVNYTRPRPRDLDASFYRDPPIARYLRGLAYTYQGTETVDGQRLYRYTVSNTSQLTPSEHGLAVIPPENVDSIESQLRVTESGVVRSFDYAVVGNNSEGVPVRYELSVRYDRVGSTTIEEPAWFAEALDAL